MLTLSPETEALVRAEATKLGQSEDEVIRNALARTAIGRDIGRPDLPSPARDINLTREEFFARIDEISRRHVARPLLDPRTDDEILGYDENGLFK